MNLPNAHTIARVVSCATAATLALVAPFVAPLHAQAKPVEPPANGRNPAVAPDGLRIQYVSENPAAPGAYIINADGTHATRITTDKLGRPVWSADGQRLISARVVHDTIHVVSTALDGASTELGMVAFAEVKGATVSSDGKHVVFGAGSWTATQLFAATIGSNAAPVSLTTPKGDAWWCQVISRDNQRVAVGRMDASRQMQVWVMKIDGSDAHAVTHFAASEGSPQCPAWSFDGKRLAVQSAVPLASDTTKHIGNIWIVDIATGKATMLGEHRTTPYLDELPAWFPDGKRVAFNSNRTGRWEVWVINVDGTGARQVTH